jgi:ligand-binding sensor domain-containing protein/serine phosphatase RsbU (regulator of sigma subunit)
MQKIITIVLCILGICSSGLNAQLIPFQNYTVKNGLPSNIIYDIEQDHEGYLWFATQAGAVKFDGYNFHSYTVENGLPDNNILDIYIDHANKIWLATENGGLAVIHSGKVDLLNTNNGLVSNNSLGVFEDKKGNIWYVSQNGISIIRSNGIQNLDESNSPITGMILDTYISASGTIWISTLENLFYFDDTLHAYQNTSLSGMTILDINEDKPGSLWFATQDKGVFHVNESGTKCFNSKNGLKSNISVAILPVNPDTIYISTSYPGGLYKIANDTVIKKWESALTGSLIKQILLDKHKRIWLSTSEHGVVLLDNNELNFLNVNNNLVNNQITKIFEDANGNIWIATLYGISKYGKVIFQIYRDGFIENDINIQSIAEYNNTIYLGSYSGFNVLKNNRIIRTYDNTNGLPFYTPVLSILPISDQDIWLANYGGLTYFSHNRFSFYPAPFLQSKDETFWISDIKSSDGIIYCASQKGLTIFDKQKYTLLNKDSFQDISVWSLEIDRLKNIWCATVDGLLIYDGSSFHRYDTSKGLPHNYCNDITFDSEGNAWLATDKGISKIRLHDDWTISCQNITSDEGLKSNIIFLILVDKKGYIWAGHNLGLDRIDPVDLSITSYGAKEGFLPVETSLGAATTTSGDELWFGTGEGAVKYLPKNDYTYTDPPIVYITNVNFYNDSSSIQKYASGLNEETRLPVDLVLPYHKNNLVFDYIGLHYTIVKKNKYRYILEGYDNDWSEPTTEIRTPPYRKIPPGNYVFKVIAANCDGVWTLTPASFSFEIRPPFWQTWWFYSLEIIIAIAVLILIIRLRERKLRHDKKVLTEKVKERTIEIEKQRDQIAIQKKEITDSIEYAEKIQTAVLPKTEFIDKLLNEYFILFKPRNIVSGDFYWINSIGGKIILVAADCTGHGVPGAFMSMLGISILNEIVSQKQRIEAGNILDTLREHLTRTLWQTGQEEDAKDGMDLALCLIDPSTQILQFAGAYNPLILIRDDEVIVYKADRMPVGFHFGEMPPFTTQKINLLKGDCIYLFSDGYADQFGGPEGKKFMSLTLRNLLLELSPLPMSEQKIRLNETIENWKGINEQVDDILLIGIRF